MQGVQISPGPKPGFTAGIRGMRTGLLVLATFVFAFIWHYNFFYRSGGYFFDAGANAFLFYRNGVIPEWPSLLELQVPSIANHSHNFFQYHICPTLSLVSIASYVFPWGRLEWFSFCMAVSFSLITWTMCSAVDFITGDRPGWVPAIAGGVVAATLAFSGFTFTCLGYPHLEICLVATGLCFLVMLFRGKTGIAAMFFALACGVREDAGFHLAAILFAFWIATFFKLHLAAYRRRFLIFAALAFASSIVLLVIQKFFFALPPGAGSPLGISFFSNGGLPVDAAVIFARIAALGRHGAFLWLPVAITFLWTVVRKDWLLPLGWLAYLPWLLLNFLSSDKSRQIMSLYHAFPFFFSLAWLVLITPKAGLSPANGRKQAAPWMIACVAISSLLGWTMQYPGQCRAILTGMTALPLPKTEPFHRMDRALSGHTQFFGRMGMDGSAACLFSAWAPPSALDTDRCHYDTLVFFKNSMFRDLMDRVAIRDRIFHFYNFTGTGVIVATRFPLPDAFEERRLFQPYEFLLPLASFDPKKAVRAKDGTIAQTQDDGCIVVFGPNIALPPGKYHVDFMLDGVNEQDRKQAASFHDQPVAVMDVTTHEGNIRLGQCEMAGGRIPALAGIDFIVTGEAGANLVEFRVASRGRGRIAVKSIALTALEVPAE